MALHDDLLSQAKYLANREPKRPKQASLRRAVSTAYYALFHLLVSDGVAKTVQPALRKYVQRIAEHGSMKQVCTAWASASASKPLGSISAATAALISNPIEPQLQNVASAFVDLQQARHQADYDTATPLTKVGVLAAILQVEKAFSDWKTVRSSPNATIFLAALLFEKQRKQR